jgi:hypothetical protein
MQNWVWWGRWDLNPAPRHVAERRNTEMAQEMDLSLMQF